jgi:hypothetical protein
MKSRRVKAVESERMPFEIKFGTAGVIRNSRQKLCGAQTSLGESYESTRETMTLPIAL